MTASSTLPRALPFRLDRTVVINAAPETVFRFFTDSERFAKWWGAGSTVDPRPGGRVYIKLPGVEESVGEFLEITAPKRVVFTYGYVSGKPIPAGSSRVTIELERIAAGTRVKLSHELADKRARDEHVQGWRFQLSLFANVVANEVNADAAQRADRWFEVWAEPDADKRAQALRAIASPAIRFQDQFSNLDGADDVLPHIAAAQRFMPGLRIQRNGAVRHCQGMALVDWVASASDGAERGRGTNAFVFGPTGLIEWVTGFWNPPNPPNPPAS
jgi:uncharacterized protein YndB with AHSA1/START domain